MKKALKMVGLLLVVGFVASASFGLTLGQNITVWDQHGSQHYEDQELDAGDRSQTATWDIEGFFLSGWSLSVVGEYDFQGVLYNPNKAPIVAGDIFIDTDGVFVKPGNNGDEPGDNGAWGYDYVVDIDWDQLEYDIFDLTAGGVVCEEVSVVGNEYANPVRRFSGGSQVGTTKSFAYNSYASSEVQDLVGTSHNVAAFDLSDLTALDGGSGSIASGTHFHITMDCGNDVMNGQVPDGGLTITLLGIGLVGLRTLARKRR